MRKLTKLRVTEISAVKRGAGEGCEIKIVKSHDTPLRRIFSKLTNEQLSVAGTEDDNKFEQAAEDAIHPKLRQYVNAMIIADPSLQPEEAMRRLLHTSRGKFLAEHLNNVTKKEHRPMPSATEVLKKFHDVVQTHGIIPIAKRITDTGHTALSEHEFSTLLMEHAKLNKRDGESDHSAFSRLFQNDLTIRKAHALCKQA